MKQKLLFLTLFVTSICYSQIPINDFFSAPSSYALVTSGTAIDQSADGANLTWNFNDLTKTGNTEDAISAATSTDIATYPGTTSVLTTTNTDTMEEGKLFIKEDGSMISTTGFTSPDFTLNYNTDNFLVGTYPLSYNATVTDAIAGGYTYLTNGTTASGTFSGTADTSVDAYGTLTTNIDSKEEFSGPVTRIKGTQSLTLSHPLFGNIGTVIITTYSYYDENDNGNIVFRSNRFEISVTTPVVSNEDFIIYEGVLSNTLGVNQTESALNSIKIVPNPVADFLNVHIDNNQVIKSITITDITGKEVLKSQGKTSLPISHLQTGLYIASITTENNHFALKFLKK